MKRPDKTSQVYDHHAAAQIGMASRDYTKDLEAYCDYIEKMMEHYASECYGYEEDIERGDLEYKNV